MPTVQPPTPLSDALGLGLQTISSNQSVTFRQYERIALSDDGTVFWVFTGTEQDFTGSLHVLTEKQQNEDETLGANSLIFSAKAEISELNGIAPNTLWIGSFDAEGVTLKVAFSGSGSNYQQSELWHYRGFAVYPALQSQIIESEYDIPSGLIVSNSLPIWLSLSTPELPIYPSFLVPDNITPPYISAHIGAEDTQPDQPVAQLIIGEGDYDEFTMTVNRLMADRVRFTCYGLDNQKVWNFYQLLVDSSLLPDALYGLKDVPLIQDDKRPQPEISAIAMKKIVTMRVSYNQWAANVAARRLILQAGFSSVTTH